MKKLTAALIFVCLLSCHHDIVVDDNVWVRIENSTAVNFDNTAIGSVDYSTVPTSGVTEYKLMPFQIFGAGCEFNVNGQHLIVGNWICGSPPPPCFPGGRYTFKVIPAPGGNPPYRIEVIID